MLLEALASKRPLRSGGSREPLPTPEAPKNSNIGMVPCPALPSFPHPSQMRKQENDQKER